MKSKKKSEKKQGTAYILIYSAVKREETSSIRRASTGFDGLP